jgi:hypothetical protein
LDAVADLAPVILHEQANSGRTIIEKFEDHASEAAFAVVLLTGDDDGRIRGSGEQRRELDRTLYSSLGSSSLRSEGPGRCAVGRGRRVALRHERSSIHTARRGSSLEAGSGQGASSCRPVTNLNCAI